LINLITKTPKQKEKTSPNPRNARRSITAARIIRANLLQSTTDMVRENHKSVEASISIKY